MSLPVINAMNESALPETIEQAVRLLKSLIEKGEQDGIAAMPESDLIRLHRGLGQWIRNNMGLWQGNARLLAATGERHPDDASGVIIQAFWQVLQDERTKVH